MTKPAGAIEAADGGLIVDDSGYTVYVPARCARPAPDWSGGHVNSQPHSIAARQLTIGAGESETERAHTAGADEATVSGAVTCQWSDYADDEVGGIIERVTFTAPPYALTPGAPGRCSPGTHIENDAANRNVELMAWWVEFTSDDDYTDIDPAPTRKAEIMGRNTGATSWRPYDVHRPVSAWLMMRGVANTISRLAFESRQSWSFPA